MRRQYISTPNVTCTVCGVRFYRPPGQLAKGWGKCCSFACNSVRRRIPVEQRMAAKTEQTETCALWVGKCYPNGYGEISIDGRSLLAHRVAYELAYGPIPKGMQVLHRCDVRNCVRPDHLFLGSQLDNMRDMIAKGRGASGPRPTARVRRGVNHMWTKLNDDQVREIRRAYAAHEGSQEALGRRFGIAQTLVSQIVRGKVWKHLL